MHRRLRSSFQSQRRPNIDSSAVKPAKFGPTRSLFSASLTVQGKRPQVTPRTSSLPPEQDVAEPVAELDAFADLFTTPTPLYSPSFTSTLSSGSHNRDRVLGLVPDTASASGSRLGTNLTGGSKLFLPPNVADVLPFAADHPFAAWDPSTRGDECSSSKAASDGWSEQPRQNGLPGKRIWTGERANHSVYGIGYERDIQDLEARLHETMWEIAGERHTCSRFEPGKEPKTVLDVSSRD